MPWTVVPLLQSAEDVTLSVKLDRALWFAAGGVVALLVAIVLLRVRTRRIVGALMLLAAIGLMAGGALLRQRQGGGTIDFQHVSNPIAGGRPRPVPWRVAQGAELALDLGDGVRLELVRLPGGEFPMGAQERDWEADPGEFPQHKVTIQSFYIGRHEVTRAQYRAVRGYDPSTFKDSAEYPDLATEMTLPADGVSWSDAQGWCEQAGLRTGYRLRLLSEAEWEYACRAGASTPFASGKQLTADDANIDDVRKHPMPVGCYPPNAFGLFDMHGNVAEWVQDTFQATYDGAPADGSAWVDPKDRFMRVHRGGSWASRSHACRTTARAAAGTQEMPEIRNAMIGFRVAIDGGN